MHLPIRRLHDVYDAGAARAAQQSEDCFVVRETVVASALRETLAMTGLATRGRCFFAPRGCWLGMALRAAFNFTFWAFGIFGLRFDAASSDARTTQSPASCEASPLPHRGRAADDL